MVPSSIGTQGFQVNAWSAGLSPSLKIQQPSVSNGLVADVGNSTFADATTGVAQSFARVGHSLGRKSTLAGLLATGCTTTEVGLSSLALGALAGLSYYGIVKPSVGVYRQGKLAGKEALKADRILYKAQALLRKQPLNNDTAAAMLKNYTEVVLAEYTSRVATRRSLAQKWGGEADVKQLELSTARQLSYAMSLRSLTQHHDNTIAEITGLEERFKTAGLEKVFSHIFSMVLFMVGARNDEDVVRIVRDLTGKRFERNSDRAIREILSRWRDLSRNDKIGMLTSASPDFVVGAIPVYLIEHDLLAFGDLLV